MPLLVFGCAPWSGPLQRLGPHFLGWVPYVVIWYIVWDTFAYSVEYSRAQGGGAPPDFVYAIVIGQMVVFSSFAAVQLFQQSSHYGCEKYWLGECAYVVLSVVSKGLLGGVLLANILLSSTFDVDEALTARADGSPSAQVSL